MDQHVKHQARMTVPELLGPGEMVMVGGKICGKWEQSSIPIVGGAGVGIGMGSTESLGGGGHHFEVASNVEQTLLVVEVEASPAVNMMAPRLHRVWEMGGDLGDGGPVGGIMAGVDGMIGVDGMVGMRVVLESAL